MHCRTRRATRRRVSLSQLAVPGLEICLRQAAPFMAAHAFGLISVDNRERSSSKFSYCWRSTHLKCASASFDEETKKKHDTQK
jgi:hypothetical protein